jgi:hypothetical protein
MTEVRADWLPDTLRHLDTFFEQHRADVPATRRPSEIWQEQCLMSLSFVHKAEVAMRHDMGIETIFFGRDYPHAEGTWPNTADWLRDAFAGVPEDVTGRAKAIMQALIDKDEGILGIKHSKQPQKTFDRDDLIAALEDVNLDNITPLDSLKLLSDIKHKMSRRQHE